MADIAGGVGGTSVDVVDAGVCVGIFGWCGIGVGCVGSWGETYAGF